MPDDLAFDGPCLCGDPFVEHATYDRSGHRIFSDFGRLILSLHGAGSLHDSRDFFDQTTGAGLTGACGFAPEPLVAVSSCHGLYLPSRATESCNRTLESASGSRGSNVSYHEISRPLIRKAELMHDTRADELFVLARSTPPMRCGRAIFFRRPELVAKVAANRFYKGMAVQAVKA